MNEQEEDVQVLREILARELETINNYQNLLARASSPEVAAFISHIIDEEKEHVAESMTLINRIDVRQAIRFTDSDHWREDGTVSIEREDQIEEPKSLFTVGSLRGTRSV